MFEKVLIANRGEIAIRIMRACRELDMKSVAVYSDADKTSLYTNYADEKVPLGNPSPKQSYLNPHVFTIFIYNIDFKVIIFNLGDYSLGNGIF